MFVGTIAPRSGPPLHIHHEADEFFYVLTAGMSATLPRGVAHRFDNCTDRPARALTVVTPGSGAGFFDDVDRARPRMPEQRDVLAAIVARHAIEFVDTPPA